MTVFADAVHRTEQVSTDGFPVSVLRSQSASVMAGVAGGRSTVMNCTPEYGPQPAALQPRTR
ncbi:hypothetical protein [Lysobacter gummosus]|uniref:hypothetical protein n=1 Tax=Lysobacter gummosus TaxID=262324 RepID=UPI003625048E